MDLDLDDLVVGYIRIGDRRAVVGPCDRDVHIARGFVLEPTGKRRYASVIEVVYPLRHSRRLGVAEPVLVGGDVRFVGVEDSQVVFGVGHETPSVGSGGPPCRAGVIAELALET